MCILYFAFFFFFFNDPATTEIYTLSLHDALPISVRRSPGTPSSRPYSQAAARQMASVPSMTGSEDRSEEHTSELQSRRDLVCRLLLEKKKKKNFTIDHTYKHSTHQIAEFSEPYIA